MENKELRSEAKSRNVKHWQIADYIGISESTLVHWLRKKLPADKEKQVYEAIHAIAAKQEAAQ